MTTYAITVRGRDDETVAHVDLTESEAAAITRVAERINTVRHSCCHPSMNVSSGPNLPAETTNED